MFSSVRLTKVKLKDVACASCNRNASIGTGRKLCRRLWAWGVGPSEKSLEIFRFAPATAKGLGASMTLRVRAAARMLDSTVASHLGQGPFGSLLLGLLDSTAQCVYGRPGETT